MFAKVTCYIVLSNAMIFKHVQILLGPHVDVIFCKYQTPQNVKHCTTRFSVYSDRSFLGHLRTSALRFNWLYNRINKVQCVCCWKKTRQRQTEAHYCCYYYVLNFLVLYQIKTRHISVRIQSASKQRCAGLFLTGDFS